MADLKSERPRAQDQPGAREPELGAQLGVRMRDAPLDLTEVELAEELIDRGRLGEYVRIGDPPLVAVALERERVRRG